MNDMLERIVATPMPIPIARLIRGCIALNSLTLAVGSAAVGRNIVVLTFLSSVR